MTQPEVPLISVVIITRNEATHIAAAIEAVLPEVARYPGAEILVVDSASTDRTVDIARRYPVGVVRLSARWPLSAAAGRYIGDRLTSGQFILHLDGDMVLTPGWLETALPLMQANPHLAGVSGYWVNLTVENGRVVHRETLEQVDRPTPVKELGGAALYRRQALVEVGGFQPFIRSYEEPELCARLRHAGYTLLRLPGQICDHYGLPEHSAASYRRRWRSKLWIGCGQMLRYHLGKETFREVATLQGSIYFLSNLLGFAAFLGLSLLGLVSRKKPPLLVAGAGAGAAIGALYYKKRSLAAVALNLWLRGLIVLSGLEGFFTPPLPPDQYPTDVEIIQPIPAIKADHASQI